MCVLLCVLFFVTRVAAAFDADLVVLAAGAFGAIFFSATPFTSSVPSRAQSRASPCHVFFDRRHIRVVSYITKPMVTSVTPRYVMPVTPSM